VKTTEAAKGTALAQPEEDYAVTDASNVENICQAVNPAASRNRKAAPTLGSKPGLERSSLRHQEREFD
jgi:hypothetical protein